MNILFVCDPLASFHIEKDSTFTMMREAQQRGHAVWACETQDLFWQSGARVSAHMQQLSLTGDPLAWFTTQSQEIRALADVDVVIMRKDPPFDNEYFYATHLLSQAAREGARVFNSPQALREHPEKLALMEFAEFASPTLVTRSAQAIRDFHTQHSDIILKPLDGMGGMVETLNRDGSTSVMVQKFLPAIAQGDKRVLVIDGEPVPFALARIPQGNEVRGNLAAGGKGVAQPLSLRDRQIAEKIGPVLAARGLLLVGLDIIGDCLTEINVTSPTCFREITDQTGFDVPAMFMTALERRLAAPP